MTTANRVTCDRWIMPRSSPLADCSENCVWPVHCFGHAFMRHQVLAGAVLLAVGSAACSGTARGTADIVDISEPPPDLGPAPKGPSPDFGTAVSQADAPPPVSGGTMMATQDGKRLVAADPDRDQVYIVSLADRSVVTVPLQRHDEPGRVIEDASGQAHVVLRGGGAIATIDLASGALLSRRAICAAPRGIAFDATGARVLVACEGGEVVQAGTASSAVPTTFTKLDRDLRDIVVSGTRIFVSRFREAETIELDTNGALVTRTTLFDNFGAGTAVLAWRMIAPSQTNGQPIVVHQSATTQVVETTPGGYGSGSSNDLSQVDQVSFGGGIVSSLVYDGVTTIPLPSHAVLPVDIAFDGKSLAVVAAGNGHTKSLPQIFVVNASVDGGIDFQATHLEVKGQATSIALLDAADPDTYAVLSREPAQIELIPSGVIIPLSTVSREDTGHAIFHSNSGSGLACASCHGEGRDDGHVWTFDSIGPRRTPSMLGTLNGTAPYHWDGDQADLPVLVDNVMTGRMNGPTIDPLQKSALQSWLFALPGPIAPTVTDAASVERGRVLFSSSDVGCTGCHSGASFTSPGTFDVGTGGRFQIPALIGVGARAPYLHDGRAATLTDRFNREIGGGDQHGKTSQLTTGQVADLVSYLGSL